ncbi:hypothetical protein [Nocardioides limicola]|uniref:hypothetical protein n=1 Tax=Nocardioides limicola TaxID=2803368 RepID=UPI00193B48A1|nr:hypothetical protein [Nocardioides sp. DJM-14]
MSREHRRPLFAFIFVTLACVVIIGNAVDSHGDGRPADLPLASVMGGVQFAPQTAPALPGFVVAPMHAAEEFVDLARGALSEADSEGVVLAAQESVTRSPRLTAARGSSATIPKASGATGEQATPTTKPAASPRSHRTKRSARFGARNKAARAGSRHVSGRAAARHTSRSARPPAGKRAAASKARNWQVRQPGFNRPA